MSEVIEVIDELVRRLDEVESLSPEAKLALFTELQQSLAAVLDSPQ